MLMNAYDHLSAPRDWHTLDDVGEHFAEPGAIDAFARLAADWLAQQLPPPQIPAGVQTAPSPSAAPPDSSVPNRPASDR